MVQRQSEQQLADYPILAILGIGQIKHNDSLQQVIHQNEAWSHTV